MKGNIEERACQLALYIIENKATVRGAAQRFGISKSTVHMDNTKQNALSGVFHSPYSKPHNGCKSKPLRGFLLKTTAFLFCTLALFTSDVLDIYGLLQIELAQN